MCNVVRYRSAPAVIMRMESHSREGGQHPGLPFDAVGEGALVQHVQVRSLWVKTHDGDKDTGRTQLCAAGQRRRDAYKAPASALTLHQHAQMRLPCIAKPVNGPARPHLGLLGAVVAGRVVAGRAWVVGGGVGGGVPDAVHVTALGPVTQVRLVLQRVGYHTAAQVRRTK